MEETIINRLRKRVKNYSDTGVAKTVKLKQLQLNIWPLAQKLTWVWIPIVKLKQRVLPYSYFPCLKSQ